MQIIDFANLRPSRLSMNERRVFQPGPRDRQAAGHDKALYRGRAVLDKSHSRFIDPAKELRLEYPFDETVTLGPLSSNTALQFILRKLRKATGNGAEILLGGRPSGPSFRHETRMKLLQSPMIPPTWPSAIGIHRGCRTREKSGESYRKWYGIHRLSLCEFGRSPIWRD